jgi:hypothetical protein
LVTSKSKRKRSKVTVFLLFPLIAFIAIAGWVMCSVGEQKAKSAIQSSSPKRDHVTIGVIALEQTQELSAE